MSTSLLAGLALALTLQGPAPDRSGEAALKSLLVSMGSLTGMTLQVSQFSRDSATSDFYSGNNSEIYWDGPTKFRVAASNMWGDGSLFVGNGTMVVSDPLDLSQAITVRDFNQTVTASVTELALKGGWQLVAIYLLDGEKSFDKLVLKESSVRADSSTSAITVTRSPFGTLTIYWFESKGRKIVSKVEYDNWDSKVDLHNRFPEWVDMPSAGTLDVEMFRYLSLNKKLSPMLFDTRLPKGATISDERKKKPATRVPIRSSTAH